jgi:isoleucyl-tRNA synthetase
MMRRVDDVLDCWFESGSMPFCQVHYPFENKEWFDSHFPGDFIVEYVGQTRGWFYTLMVMATALFDKAPFRSAICHGVVLDENKQKLSKRLKNYPDPVAVFNDYGADALRWYMVSSPLLSGGDLAMPKDGRAIGDAVRSVLLPIWNAYSFFTLYANIDGVKARLVTSAEAELDRYILGKTADLVTAVERAMDRLDLAAACDSLPPFIEALNNWYIRRSRERFWKSEKDADKTAAYDTLYTVLVTLCRTMAPFLPYLTEHIHRALCDGASVHLQDWPDASAFTVDHALVERMDMARDVCSAAASIRMAKNLRNRLPLHRLTVAHPRHGMLASLRDVITEEANVKDVVFADKPSEFGAEVLVLNPRIVGKRLSGAMKDVLAAAKAGNWRRLDAGAVEVVGHRIEPGEYEVRFQARQGLDAVAFDGNAGVVVLDTKVTPDLEREGLARDFVRLIQVARKDAGFNVADRIVVEVKAGPLTRDAVGAFIGAIREETLAVSLDFTEGTPAGFVSEQKLQDEAVAIGVRVAA